MHGRSNTTRVNQEAPPQAFADAEYDSDVDAANDAIGAPNTGGAVEEHDNTEHLRADMFSKPQRIIIDFDITASPAELQANPKKLEWALREELLSKFKANTATSNRDLAGEDKLMGNLSRAILLNMRIIQQANTFPFFMGLNITDMMPVNLHMNGACVWRIPPDTKTMKVDENVFEPTNFVTRYMYENVASCSPEDLNASIRHIEGTKTSPAHAMIAVGSLAHAWLKSTLKGSDRWNGELGKELRSLAFNPADDQAAVQVTSRIASELHEELSGPINDAMAAFTNLNDLRASYHRADDSGNNITSPKNIAGSIAGDNTTEGTAISDEMMQIKCMAHVKAELVFNLF